MAKTSPFTHYNRKSIEFLVELTENNDRDWFKANQPRYEAAVRVTAPSGEIDVATTTVEARTKPPPGPLGVSINDAARWCA